MRLPTISPTKLATYLACPNKYNWLYMDPRGKWYTKSKSYYSFGTTLHKVLQRLHDSQDVTVTSVEQAVAALDEEWISAGYSSAAEMSEAFGDGKEIIMQYAKEFQQRDRESKTIFVEKQFSKIFETFKLIGRVDRVEEYPDGTIEIVDYKSGRELVTSEDIASDIAMSCYQLLVREAFPGRKIIATIIAIRSGRQASYSLTDDEKNEFENDLIHLSNEIINADFEERTPVPKALCRECDFLSLCKKNPDFAVEEIARFEQLY